jgi:hypothetical protein
MRVHLTRRLSDRWLSAAELVHESYFAAFGARILPDPDCFITGTSIDGPRSGQVLACAGMTFGTEEKALFSERYLSEPVEQAIAGRFGSIPRRRRVVEVGALAGRVPMAGREIIRVTPIVAWCLGMEYILCTATQSLMKTLARLDIPFMPLDVACRERLDPPYRDCWGSYYDEQPQVGVIPLENLSWPFTTSAQPYSFLELSLLTDDITGPKVSSDASA